MKKTLFLIILLFSLPFSEDQLTDDRLKLIHSFLDQDEKKDYALDFSLHSYTDSLYTLSELRGKVVLLNFWATWCGPCRQEIPDFNNLYDQYNDQGFEILGISISDSKKQLTNFAKVYDVHYPLLYGTDKEIEEVSNSFGGIPAVPWSFLLSANGKIISTFPGAILRDYDPVTFQRLINNIEDEIKLINQDLK